MKTIQLYRFAFADDGCLTDDRTEAWLRKNRWHATRFDSIEGAIAAGKQAILGALDAEMKDTAALTTEGVARKYHHVRGEWTSRYSPDGVVDYEVPYSEREVQIDWSTNTVQVGPWVESDYPECRRIYVDVENLVVLETGDSLL